MAAICKELLNVIPAAGVKEMRTINEAIKKLSVKLAANTASSQRLKKYVSSL
jgi:hypothetical protein